MVDMFKQICKVFDILDVPVLKDIMEYFNFFVR